MSRKPLEGRSLQSVLTASFLACIGVILLFMLAMLMPRVTQLLQQNAIQRTKETLLQSVSSLEIYIDNMVSTMQTTFDVISETELCAIAGLLMNTKGRIEVYGVGSSSMIANDVYYRLMRIGLPIYAVTDPHISAVSASLLNGECVAIGISHSGRTIETLDTMKRAKERGAKTVCVTDYANSPLAKLCDYAIVIASKEAEVHKEAVTARLAQLLVFDSLCAYISCQKKDRTVGLMDNVIDIIGEHREKE